MRNKKINVEKLLFAVIGMFCIVLVLIPLRLGNDNANKTSKRLLSLESYAAVIKFRLMEAREESEHTVLSKEWLEANNENLDDQIKCGEMYETKNGDFVLNHCQIGSEKTEYCYYGGIGRTKCGKVPE